LFFLGSSASEAMEKHRQLLSASYSRQRDYTFLSPLSHKTDGDLRFADQLLSGVGLSVKMKGYSARSIRASMVMPPAEDITPAARAERKKQTRYQPERCSRRQTAGETSQCPAPREPAAISANVHWSEICEQR